MNYLLDADFSAVECRIVNWLSNQEDALERFRRYDAATSEDEKVRLDPYRIQASTIFDVPVQLVNKHPQRFVGKQAELGCGFQLGPAGFRKGCLKYGYDLPPNLEFKAVETWRAEHKEVVRSWYEIDRAAKEAIAKKGTVTKARRLKFLCRNVEDTPFLLMLLPSGRKLAYPRPRIGRSRKFEGATVIEFFGNIKGNTWGMIDTYGGRLLENATQAVAADLMINGTRNCENAGYETATLIHDECLAYYHPERGQTAEEFVKLLTTLPKWADGLPIAAEGELVPFYKK